MLNVRLADWCRSGGLATIRATHIVGAADPCPYLKGSVCARPSKVAPGE
ncbi:hypothetical protein P3T39_007052 [Kitasatospora sp. GP82]|nr:hypothetical protein [Kitasatospora sp. GP82]